MRPTYTIEGSAKLQAKLNALGKEARTAKRRGLSRAGKFATKMMKGVVWVDTGSTKKAIGITRLGDATGSRDAIFVGVRRDKEYAVARYQTKRGKTITKLRQTREGSTYREGVFRKMPVTYAVYRERVDPKLGPIWQKIKGKCAQILFQSTWEEIDKLKKG